MMSIDVASKLNSVQLANVFVDRINLQNKQDTEPLPPGTPVRWRIDLDVGYRVAGPTELRIRVGAKLLFEESSPKPFDLELAVVGVYQSMEPIGEEQIPALIKTHSVPLLLPYIRELVSDLTSRMGGPVIMAPVLRVAFAPPDAAAVQASADSSGVETTESQPKEPSRAKVNTTTPKAPKRARRG